jgi:hypothetical protein
VQAIDDSLITGTATHMLAREAGVPVTGPSLLVPFGLTEVTAATTTGMIILDENPGDAPSPFNIPPVNENGTHGGAGDRAVISSMLRELWETGMFTHACAVDGAPAPCDCDTGACGDRL